MIGNQLSTPPWRTARFTFVVLGFLLLLETTFAQPALSQSAKNPRLKVSANKRFLVHVDGGPFFYLGDTAWELFHRLNREEADRYLQNRAAKGFTVIQAVVLAELDGLKTPNPYGDLPFHGNDPSQPNEAYFKHVDFVIAQAAALGLYIGMLPTWWTRLGTTEIILSTKRMLVGMDAFWAKIPEQTDNLESGSCSPA